MKKTILFILVLLPLIAISQINDDFEDGNIDSWTESTTSNWETSDVNPLNGTYSLHHAFDNTVAGHDQISHEFGDIGIGLGTVTWRFQVKYEYNPSGYNTWSVFLFADNDATEMYPGGSVNGYVLGVNFSGTTDLIKLWKVTDGSSSQILDTEYNWQDNIGTSTTAGFEITRTADGEWTIFLDADGGFDNLVQIGDSVTDTDFINANYFGICHEYTMSADQLLWFDDISCTGTAANNTDSEISAGDDTEPLTISSVENSADGVQVFDVKFTDLSSGDGLPTIIDNLQFTQGSNNDISDWTNAIAGAKLFGIDIPAGLEGSVYSSTISFASDDFISINDGENETYQLYIWLNTDLSDINDNDNLEFQLHYNNIVCDVLGSSFGSGDIESGDNNIAIDIEATNLFFSSFPNMVGQNTDFSVSVAVTDANNNTDTDATNSVTLSLATGSGNLTSANGLSQNLISGEYTWTDLQYDVLENFTIQADATGLISTVTSNIECADFVYHLDDDFEDGEISDWQQSEFNHWESSNEATINGTYSLKQIYDNPESGLDVIAHPITVPDINSEKKTWRFQVKYENSAPSSNNHWSIFLFADDDETEMNTSSTTINGYVLGVNYNGSDDMLTLWNITNGLATPIITTTFDWNETTSSEPKGFEITRSITGEWEIKIDDENGGFDNLISYGTATDATHTTANYFGIYYKYSSTQDLQLTIDDVYFGPFIPDIQQPTIDTLIVLSSNHLQIIFSENVEQTTAETLTNYTVNNDIGNPATATLNAINHRVIDLEFDGNFLNDEIYSLTIQNIEDEVGNIIETVNIDFEWTNIILSSANVISNTEIDLNFSKIVDITTAQTLPNYIVDNGIGSPTSAIIEETDSSQVHLTFATEFISGENYILTINNIQDRYGNPIEETNYSFMYNETQQFDIVINELMVDVSPIPVALPAEKYIELYNNSDFDINLSNWTLQIGTNSASVFPNITILAHEYVIICEDNAETSFTAYGTTIPILTASQLTSTTGKRITIRNNLGQIIEAIIYSPDWYQDPEKDDGGWSLERIDVDNVCNQDNNWRASNNYIGGTPGMLNSVTGNNPDNDSPAIENVEFISSKEVLIDFTENVDTATAFVGINYILTSSEPNVTPLYFSVDENDYSKIYIEFLSNFDIGTNTIQITNIADNCSNTIADTTISFNYELINPYIVEPKSENQIKVYFTETVEITTAENVNNYFVNNSIGIPTIAVRDLNDNSIVHLQFDGSFTEDNIYSITINGIQDVNENMMDETQLDFNYHITQPFDVVINEIMVDVNPEPLGLPAEQYIELYNTSDYDIWLSEWIFQAEGQSGREFSNVYISAGGYLLICEDDKISDFDDYCPTVVGILGSTDLSQSGKELLLKDNTGNLIYYANYSETWYQDEEKEDGGWSIEKIDYDNFCGTNTNWRASEDLTGGTPGRINSIYTENIDETLPEIQQINLISSNHLLVQFSKNISFATALEPSNYSISNNVGNPTTVSKADTGYTTVHLYFEEQFTNGQEYFIEISNIADDCGNVLEAVTDNFTYYLIEPKTIWVLSSSLLQIKFSEEVEYLTSTTTTNYVINKEIGSPDQVVRDANDPSIVYLQFETEFTDGQTYNIQIENITDINNNTIENAELEFIYYIAKLSDIVINEVLFNPYPGGSDFIELYNRSEYPINLIDLRLASRDYETNEIENIYRINTQNKILQPSTYLVISTDTSIIQSDYSTDGTFIQMSSVPSYPDDEGTIIILNTKDSIIDEFTYNEDMHFALISNTDGISLERIDYNMPTQDSSNWHSAAQNVGYATPGYENSQYKDLSDVEENTEITIDPKVFSPDNDGYHDVLNIYYEFEQSGYVANITIFDVKGKLIRALVQNELLSVSGYWTWDGLMDNSAKARIGIYAVIIEVFDLDGNVETYKLGCAISGKVE